MPYEVPFCVKVSLLIFVDVDLALDMSPEAPERPLHRKWFRLTFFIYLCFVIKWFVLMLIWEGKPGVYFTFSFCANRFTLFFAVWHRVYGINREY